MSWASPAEEWGDFGGSGSDPPPLKMSVIAYFWQSWPWWLIWNRFQVVTSWAELAHIFHIYFWPPKRTNQQGSGRRSFPCLPKYANHCWPYQNLLPFQLGWPPGLPVYKEERAHGESEGKSISDWPAIYSMCGKNFGFKKRRDNWTKILWTSRLLVGRR